MALVTKSVSCSYAACAKPIAVTVKSVLSIWYTCSDALRLEPFMGDMTTRLSIHKLRILPTLTLQFRFAADSAIGGAVLDQYFR